jgi:hypothetical protein
VAAGLNQNGAWEVGQCSPKWHRNRVSALFVVYTVFLFDVARRVTVLAFYA